MLNIILDADLFGFCSRDIKEPFDLVLVVHFDWLLLVFSFVYFVVLDNGNDRLNQIHLRRKTKQHLKLPVNAAKRRCNSDTTLS